MRLRVLLLVIREVRSRSEAVYACRPLLARRVGTSEVQARVDGA